MKMYVVTKQYCFYGPVEGIDEVKIFRTKKEAISYKDNGEEYYYYELFEVECE